MSTISGNSLQLLCLRGLFRLWVLVSMTWILVFVTVRLYPATSKYIQAVKATHQLQRLKSTNILLPYDAPDSSGGGAEIIDTWEDSKREAECRHVFLVNAEITFLPPIVVLLPGLGIMALLSGSGSKERKSRSNNFAA